MKPNVMKLKKNFNLNFVYLILVSLLVAVFIFINFKFFSLGLYYMDQLYVYDPNNLKVLVASFWSILLVIIGILVSILILILFDFAKNKDKRNIIYKWLIFVSCLLMGTGIILIIARFNQYVSEYEGIAILRVIFPYSLTFMGFLLQVISLFLLYNTIFRARRYRFKCIGNEISNSKNRKRLRWMTGALSLIVLASIISVTVYTKMNPSYIDPFEGVSVRFEEQYIEIDANNIYTTSNAYVDRDYEDLSYYADGRRYITYELSKSSDLINGEIVVVSASLIGGIEDFYNIRLSSTEKEYVVEGLVSAPQSIDQVATYHDILEAIDIKISQEEDMNAQGVSYTKVAVLYSPMNQMDYFNYTFTKGTIVVVYDVETVRNGVRRVEPYIYYVTGIQIINGGELLNKNYSINSESNSYYFKTSEALIKAYIEKYNFVEVEGE